MLEQGCPRVMVLIHHMNHPSSAALRFLLLLDPAQRRLGAGLPVRLPVYTHILTHDPHHSHHSLRISRTPLHVPRYPSSLLTLRSADQFRGRGFAGPVLLAQCVDGIPWEAHHVRCLDLPLPRGALGVVLGNIRVFMPQSGVGEKRNRDVITWMVCDTN